LVSLGYLKEVIIEIIIGKITTLSFSKKETHPPQIFYFFSFYHLSFVYLFSQQELNSFISLYCAAAAALSKSSLPLV
jgi:hypothetical protein